MARKKASVSVAEQVRRRVNVQMKDEVVTMAIDPRFRIKRVPTGILTIDRLTGGGFARGRHVLLFGDWLAGKSLLMYSTMVQAQQRGEVCALVDAEHVFDEPWFTRLGGRAEDLLLYQPKNANELGNVLRLFLQDDEEVRGTDIVGIDSVASLSTIEEQEHDFEEGDVRTASLARLMSLLLRKITTQNDDTLILWTNQWRDKVRVNFPMKSTPGGHALGFYSSTMIEMTLAEKETEPRPVVSKGKYIDRKTAIGRWVNCRLAKDKTGAQPETMASFMFDYEHKEIDLAREIIDLGMADELIARKGDYYHIATPEEAEIRLHGIKRAVTRINEDDELREWLVACIEERTAMIGADDG